MRDVFIIGAGMIRFGRYTELPVEAFASEAVTAVIADSGLDPRRIEHAVFGHSYQRGVAGQRVLKELGLTGIHIVNVDNACASGGSALNVAWMTVAGGFRDVVLVVGMEKMERGLISRLNPGEFEALLGKTMPVKYALRAKQHMEKYGTTIRQLAQVSVKNHRAGALNPYAHYQKEVTLDEVLASRPIAEPLTLLQCCPTTDGAAALVLASGQVAREVGGVSVRIAASVVTSGAYRNPVTSALSSDDDLATRAGKSAYEVAGIGPKEIDVVEVHDAFTSGEIVAYENLGLCERGEAGRLVDEGVTALGGRQPVNPSGGRLSLGHPIGATGVAQVVELTWQLQGRCGGRQVEGARTAMAHVVGGSVPGIGAGACAIHILTR